ncbi:hypothetical protein [Occultella gossypii]|uniref:Uncharacterized protein n=1 Tax=Occultella gossypii TaxID=2800820 RepID=A0ABS7SFN9_9MICO|nr:hypothetical protein [Occultella gossypii]MBZ2198101.1 hypothetical protein [Occultella gossypii]
MPRTDPAEEFTVGGADDGAPNGLRGAAPVAAPGGRSNRAPGGPAAWIVASLALIAVGALVAPTVLPRASVAAFTAPVPSLQIWVTAAVPLATVRYPPLVDALDDVDWSGVVTCADPGDGPVSCVSERDGDIFINTDNGKWLLAPWPGLHPGD